MSGTVLYLKRVGVVILLLQVMACAAWAQGNDIRILRDISLHRNRSLDGVMNGLSNSVYPVSALIPISELVVGYARNDQQLKNYGLQTIAGLGVSTVLIVGVKFAVNRDRPFVTYPDIIPLQSDRTPSFPSGHTTYAFCDATSLSLCFPKWYVIAPAYAWALAAGYSRMDLGMHYPTDVLAGAVLGTGTAWLACKGNQWLQHRKHKTDGAIAK